MDKLVSALCFDVFGTVVDWRQSIIRDLSEFGETHSIRCDWPAFADAWRGLYDPAMEEVRSGREPFTKLDRLHRRNLDRLVDPFGLTALSEEQLDYVNRVWHRLDPWPDVVAGLERLKSRYTLATLSNGNIALMVNMAKRAGLPWDVILGAEVTGYYKPQPQAYLEAADRLGIPVTQCVMVAAHNGDLRAAAAQGMRTAFVARPTEYGPGQTKDFTAEATYDWVATDFADLADQMGC